MWGGSTKPTLAGFQDFTTGVMGISNAVLPPSSPVINFCFAKALSIVSLTILNASPLNYQIAVYNLAGAYLINYAQDQPNAPLVPGSGGPNRPGLPFFEWQRKQFNIGGFVSGVIQSASDQGTSQSMIVQDAARMFTLADLQLLKTPWGREYLSIAQKIGTIWGMA